MAQNENEFFPEIYSGVAAPGDREEYSVDRLAKKHGVDGELTVEEVYELPLSVMRTLDLRGKPLDYRHKDISIGRIVDQRFKDGRDLSIDFRFNKTPLARMVKAAVEEGKMLGLSLTTHEKINTKTGDISVTPVHVAVCYEGARDRTWIESKVDAAGNKYTCVHASDEKAGDICNAECSHTCRKFIVRVLHASNESMNANPSPQTQSTAAASSASASSVSSQSSSSASSSASTSSQSSAAMSTSTAAPPVQSPPLPPQQQPQVPPPVPQAPTQPPAAPAPPAPPTAPASAPPSLPPAVQPPGSLASFGMSSAPSQPPAPPSGFYPYMSPFTWPANPYTPSPYNMNPFYYMPSPMPGGMPPAPYYNFPSAPPTTPSNVASASTSSATTRAAPPVPQESAAASSAVTESKEGTMKNKSLSDLVEEQLRPYKEQIAFLFEQNHGEPRNRPFSSAAKAPPGTESAWRGPAEKAPEMLTVRASKEYKQFMQNEAVEESDETGMWYRLKKPARVDPRAWGENSDWVSIQAIDAENTARTKTNFDTLVYGREKEGGTYEQIVVYSHV